VKTILILFAIFYSITILSQDSLSVLFVGNSYVSTNDLPTVFKNLTQSKGDIATVDSKTNGGFTFQSHVNDLVTFQKIHSKPWDFVVLQGQSQEPSFPYSQVNNSTLPYAVRLADSVYANAPCTQVQYFMTWGRQVGDPQWDSINTFNKMNKRLRDAYLRIADSSHASVSPSGPAWKYVIDNHPTINLFSGDGSHPSFAGTYLSACVFYSSIYQKSPVGPSYTGSLDAATALILQEAAALTVLDSIPTWKLTHFDSLVNVDFTYNATTGANEFQFTPTSSFYTQDLTWYFGDDTFSYEQNPVHQYMFNGTYLVELIGSGVCGTDTVTQVIMVETTSLNNNKIKDVQISLLNTGSIELSSLPLNFDVNLIKLTTIEGKSIPYSFTFKNNDTVELILNQSGVLFLSYEENGKILFFKQMFKPF
jgi:PKD repeat protein